MKFGLTDSSFYSLAADTIVSSSLLQTQKCLTEEMDSASASPSTPDYKLTDDEKIQKIIELKEKGNQAHREGNFKRASRIYYNCIMYIKGLSFYSPDILGLDSLLGSGESSGNEKRVLDPATKVLICDCHNNLSACMLKESEPKYERIIEHCNKALEMSPTNAKALFRKGLSQYSIGKYDDALETLKKAPSNDIQVRKYMELCKSEITRQDKELASKFKDMFKSR